MAQADTQGRRHLCNPGDDRTLDAKIPDPDTRDLVEFLYNAGGAAAKAKVDLKNNMVRLPAEKSKLKKPETHPSSEPFRKYSMPAGSPEPGWPLRV